MKTASAVFCFQTLILWLAARSQRTNVDARECLMFCDFNLFVPTVVIS